MGTKGQLFWAYLTWVRRRCKEVKLQPPKRWNCNEGISWSNEGISWSKQQESRQNKSKSVSSQQAVTTWPLLPQEAAGVMNLGLDSNKFMDTRSTKRCCKGWGCSEIPIVTAVNAEPLWGEQGKKTVGFSCFPFLLTLPPLETDCRAREGSALPHCGIFCALRSFICCSDHHKIRA